MSNEPDQHDEADEQARLWSTVVHLDAVFEQLAERGERAWRDAPEAKALHLLRNQIVHGDNRSTPVEMASAVEAVVRFLKLIEGSSLGSAPSHRIRRLSSASDVAAILTRADDLAKEAPVDLEAHLERAVANRLGISGNDVAPYRARIKALTQDPPTERDTEAAGESPEESFRAESARPRQHETRAERASRLGGGDSPPAATVPAARFSLDTELVRQAVAGDRAAVEELLRELQPVVFRFCLGRLGTWQDGSSDAEDCAQEVLLAVVRALPRYRYELDGFLPFVFGIAGNKVSDFRRRASGRTSPAPEWPDGRPESTDSPVDEIASWNALVRSSGPFDVLPRRWREILVLRLLLGMSAEETAAAVGLRSAGAVRVTQHRALSKLRSSLRAQNGTIS
jgi:RNA polymerase sigma-70 factor (ECF subfamily)